jgi:hypothetical protein
MIFSGFFILFGAYNVQRTLSELIPKFRHLLKLNDQLFTKFSERVERYTYSFIPSLFIALGIIFLLSDAPSQFQQALTEGFAVYVIWNLFFTSFFYLLVGTALWMFGSLWLIIFMISRQPLDLDLSQKTTEKFRELSILALWFSGFYFLSISIQIVITPGNIFTTSIREIILSPYSFWLAIGIIGIILPFYNIHIALLKLKKQRLERIEEESRKLLQELDDLKTKKPSIQVSDEKHAKMLSLFSLQNKEKQVRATNEWPIDIGFISKLVFMAAGTRALVEILTQYVLS